MLLQYILTCYFSTSSHVTTVHHHILLQYIITCYYSISSHVTTMHHHMLLQYIITCYFSTSLKMYDVRINGSSSPSCCVWIWWVWLHSKLHLPTAPPPLNEGESLVSRILQLGPPGTRFLGYDHSLFFMKI